MTQVRSKSLPGAALTGRALYNSRLRPDQAVSENPAIASVMPGSFPPRTGAVGRNKTGGHAGTGLLDTVRNQFPWAARGEDKAEETPLRRSDKKLQTAISCFLTTVLLDIALGHTYNGFWNILRRLRHRRCLLCV